MGESTQSLKAEMDLIFNQLKILREFPNNQQADGDHSFRQMGFTSDIPQGCHLALNS